MAKILFNIFLLHVNFNKSTVRFHFLLYSIQYNVALQAIKIMLKFYYYIDYSLFLRNIPNKANSKLLHSMIFYFLFPIFGTKRNRLIKFWNNYEMYQTFALSPTNNTQMSVSLRGLKSVLCIKELGHFEYMSLSISLKSSPISPCVCVKILGILKKNTAN